MHAKLIRYSIHDCTITPGNLQSLSVEQRSSFALQVCYIIANGFLDSEEEQLKDYLKYLAADPVEEIRLLITEQLKHSSYLPHEVALSLASDIGTVAAPIIEHSPQLDNADLIRIIEQNYEKNKLRALTRRANLDPEICTKICSTKDMELILAILKNSTSQIQFELYRTLINLYHDNQQLIVAVLSRIAQNMPLLEKLITELNADAKHGVAEYLDLYAKANTPPFCSTNIASFKEGSTRSTEYELRRSIDLLHSKNSLNSSVMLHYFCKGDMYSFLYGISKLSDVPFSQVKLVVMNSIMLPEFETLYHDSGLPSALLSAVRTILDVLIKTAEDNDKVKAKFSTVIKQYIKEGKIDTKIEYMDYILKLITRS